MSSLPLYPREEDPYARVVFGRPLAGYLDKRGLTWGCNMSFICEMDRKMLGCAEIIGGDGLSGRMYCGCDGFVGPPGLEPGTVRL
jgi:hypothetical protein